MIKKKVLDAKMEKADPRYFTGDAWLVRLAASDDITVNAARVTFAPDSVFTHIAIQPKMGGKEIDWLGEVSDEEYGSAVVVA